MVDIYIVEKRDDVLRIWIDASHIPPVPFIEKQLMHQAQMDIALYTQQVYESDKVHIDYTADDIPALLEHLDEVYDFVLSQITNIILWCGERIPQSKCLELLKKACA